MNMTKIQPVYYNLTLINSLTGNQIKFEHLVVITK